MKKICIVGYGAIGPVHAEALKAVKNVELTAVCEIDKTRRILCEKTYSVKGYEDFDTMLRDKEIDAIHICTPHDLHFSMIKKALEAGKQVVCEKPITMTKAEYKKLLSLPGADGVCAILQNRYNTCIQRLKEILDSGEMGKIVAVKGILTWTRDAAYYSSAPWRGNWKTEGGGVLINQAVHTLDLFSYLIGDIQTVNAQMMNYSIDTIEVEDTAIGYLTFQSGLKGLFLGTNAYGENTSPIFEVVCEQGILRYMDAKLYRNGTLLCEDKKTLDGKPYWGSSHEAVFADYYDNGIFFSPKNIKNTMDALFAMYESANAYQNIERGNTVTL